MDRSDTFRTAVGINDGVLSFGAHSVNTVTNVRLPDTPLPDPASVEAPPGLVRLHTSSGGRFVGRVAETELLDRLPATGANVITQAVTGLGGIGKTTLAAHYAASSRHRHNPVWTIAAERPEQVTAGIAELARRIHPVLAALPEPAAAQWGMSWLGSHSGWLLVLDDVAEPDDVRELVSSFPGGRFLITSRQAMGWSEFAETVALGPVSSAEARQILGAGESADVDALCEEVGRLPLALKLAGAYLEQNQVSAGEYLLRLRGYEQTVLEWVPSGDRAKRAIAGIWLSSLERVREYGPLPERLLRIMAWFAPDDIPVAVLRTDPGRSAAEVDEALGRLRSYGLISRDRHLVSVHRLVQLVVRAEQRRPAGGEDLRFAAALALSGVFLSALEDSGAPHAAAAFLPHTDAVATHIAPDEDTELSAALLVLASEFRLRTLLDWANAYQPLKRALAALRRLTGAESFPSLNAQLLLGMCCVMTGDEEPSALFEDLIARAPARSENQMVVTAAKSWLGRLYGRGPQPTRAKPLFESVIGAGRPVDAQISLTDLLIRTGRAREAVKMLREMLAEYPAGSSADDVSELRNALADALHAAGDLDEAIGIWRELREHRLADHGAGDVRVGLLGAKLVGALIARGAHHEAEALAVESIAGLRGRVPRGNPLLRLFEEVLDELAEGRYGPAADHPSPPTPPPATPPRPASAD